ncbi:MAG TPA: MATE family efflux transporter [Thermoleophilaceae bacterium]
MLRRSPHDREILRLAVPALGALAAEPLYILVDTAIVGHLGTPQLAALALAGTMLTGAFTMFNFLTYGTTAQVARYHGAGREETAGSMAAQALWLALGIGALLFVLALALAVPAVHLLGGEHRTGSMAVLYLRIGALGLPFALIALAGQGYLRGISDLRTPLVIVVLANLANVVLELLFVYGFHWGLAGSAWGTVIAQAGMAAAFAIELLRAPASTRRPQADLMRPLVRVGGDIFIRTGSLYASFLVASAVLARIGAASLGAHQVAFQLWTFLALILDAVAIAGQVIVGRMLGAGRAQEAWDASVRMLWWSLVIGGALALGMLALIDLLPHVFTTDPAVIDRLHAIWPIYALMQPINALVFALDGILIGASDTRFLKWSMVFAALGVFAPIALMSLAFGWGIVGVWCGLLGLIFARLVTCGARFVGRRWAVVGVPG